MPSRPIRDSRKDLLSHKLALPADPSHNHGLVSLPSENLTHITAYLDPLSLYALARVSTGFNAHINEEHTWRTAFLFNFLGIEPQSDNRDDKAVLLRRSEATWKQEYIARFNLKRRWERSRTPAVVHIPVQSSISKMHVMANNAVLASSLKYGIVARSIPLTGRVLRGLFSPTSTGLGIFVGNPNTQFSMDVSASDLASDGGTAKIAWGFTSGRVAAMTVPKAIDEATKSSGRLVNCSLDDQHLGTVRDIVWDDRAGCILSASVDGTVKLWDPKTLVCAATWGDPDTCNACVKLVSAMSSGAYAVAMARGDIVIRQGIQRDQDGVLVSTGIETLVPCPFKHPSDSATPYPVITDVRVALAATGTISVLATYEDHTYFYRIDLDGSSQTVVRFGDSSCGTITSVYPRFATKSEESSYIVVGDDLGWVSIYPWTSYIVPPLKRFEAHTDGAGVSFVTSNDATLLAGSTNGTVDVFDASTFQHIRTISTLESRRAPRPVTDIVLGSSKDVIVVSADDRIMAWEARQVKFGGRGGVRGRHLGGKKKAKTVANAKGFGQIELKHSINESLVDLKDEQEHVRRVNSRERRQQANLDQLGLSEAEAVEYLLMLSREEAEQKMKTSDTGNEDEDIFDMDFGDASTMSRIASGTSTVASTPSHSSGEQSPVEDNAHQSSFQSEANFPTFGTPRSASNSTSTWSRSASSWGDRSSSAITGLSPASSELRRSPAHGSAGASSSLEARRRQQEEEDLQLALQLSLQDS